MNLFWQFICVIAFGAACWAAGEFLFKTFLGEKAFLPALGRHTLAFTTGNIFFSYLLTALGFSGYFIPSALWAVFIGGFGLVVWRAVMGLRRPIQLPSLNQNIHEERGEKGIPFLLVAIVGIFLLSAIFQAAAPPYVRDTLVYHLLCPKEYLKVGRIIHIPGNIFSAFPKGHEMIMTLLLYIGGDRAAQGFSILQQMAAIGGLYSLVRLWVGSWSAFLCTIGYATVPATIYFTGCGYVEPALLMTFSNSVLLLSLFLSFHPKWISSENIHYKVIFLIAFMAGWMLTLKYTGLIYAGLIGLILLWNQRRQSHKKVLITVALFIMGIAPGLCWMVWNWIVLGNPVYPMAWFLFGGKGWDEERAFAMSLYFDVYGMGRSLLDYLLLPWRLAFSGRFDTVRFDGAIGPFLLIFLILAVISAILLIRHRSDKGVEREIGIMALVCAAFFAFGTQQTRFWLPAHLLICAFAAPAMEILVNWVKNRRQIKITLWLVLVASLTWNIGFLGKQFLATGYYKPVFGMEEEQAFMARMVPGYPAIEFINKNLPQDSKILCVWTGAYGYYIDRQYYSDTFIEDFTLKGFIHTLLNGKELSQRLTQAKFTHLFLNLSILEKNLEQSERAIFDEFLRKKTRDLFRHQNFAVFEILSSSQ